MAINLRGLFAGPAWKRVLVVAVLVTAGAAYWEHEFDTYHYKVVQPGVLYRDGNQDAKEYDNALDRSDSRTVVCLIDDKELADPHKQQFAEGIEQAGREGRRIVRLPITLGGWPKTEDVRKFLEITEKKENQPVLIHCAQGVRRTGMMVAAYQMSVLGWSKEKANKEIETFGHSERSIGDVRKFIDAYDPVTRTVTKEFKMSSE
jgi:tyrosine-protein phosphatase SIW14